MKPTRIISLSVIFVLLSSVAGSNELISGSCLDLKQSQSFHFEGVLTYNIFPGPPNFEDVRKGDKPEPTYILQLLKPICVSGDEFIDPKKQIDRIQFFQITRTREVRRCGRNFEG
jgi:hypothetical protein